MKIIWGNKAVQLGVGAQPIRRPKLTAENPATALRETQPPEMRRKAADLGAVIRAEPDGVAEAVWLTETSIGLEKK